MTLAYLLGVAFLSALAWLGYGVWRIGAITRGEKIGDRSGAALLLIDLQTVFWDDGPYPEAMKSTAQEAILNEINDAKKESFPVIALRQEWSIPSTKAIARMTMKGQAVEGTPGTELAKPFATLVDHVVVKRVQDGFETGELGALLQKLEIGRLRIVGLDFNYCVLKTSLAAQNRGYEVTVVREGTLAAHPVSRSEQLMTSSGVAVQ